MKRLLAVALLALALPASSASGDRLAVFAAASLGDVFPRVAPGPSYSFAGSDQLALQIQQGAPADVFAAASPKQTQLLYRNGLLLKPVAFATNRLIILVPRANPARIRNVYDLRREGVKLVIGDPSVPVGSYTRRLLERLGITAGVMRNVVSEETDVKGIVAKVALGEADAGFVYRTDAKAAGGRTHAVALPARVQPPIRYEVAIVKTTTHFVAARAFVKRLLTRRARVQLAKAGFGLPPLR